MTTEPIEPAYVDKSTWSPHSFRAPVGDGLSAGRRGGGENAMSTERTRRNGGGDGTRSGARDGAGKALAARDSEVRLAAAADSTHASDPWNAAVEEGRKLDLAEYPSALLLRVASVIHQESTGGYARKYGLSVPEWRILGRLCES